MQAAASQKPIQYNARGDEGMMTDSLLAHGPWSSACDEYSATVRSELEEIIPPAVVGRAQSENLFPRRVLSELGRRGHLRARWLTGGEEGDLGRAIILPYEIAYVTDSGIALGISLHLEVFAGVLASARSLPDGVDLFTETLDAKRIGCIAMTEPQSGSDVTSVETVGVRDGDGWRITGRKKFISLAITADTALVFARTGGPASLTAFLVPNNEDNGYRVVRKLKKLGTETLETCLLEIDAWVPDDHVVGKVGWGAQEFTRAMTLDRLAGCAIALGGLRSSIEIARTYLQRRKARSGVLWDHQALRHKFADLLTEQETLWKAVKFTAWGLQHGYCTDRDAAMMKLATMPRVERALSDALQLLGGAGYLDEFPVERHLRDIRIGRFGAGTDEIMRGIVAGTPLNNEAYWRWISDRGYGEWE